MCSVYTEYHHLFMSKVLGTPGSVAANGCLRPYEQTTDKIFIHGHQSWVITPANGITTHVSLSGTRPGFCQTCEMHIQIKVTTMSLWLPRLEYLAMNDGHEQA